MTTTRSSSGTLFMLLVLILLTGLGWTAWDWHTSREEALDARQNYRKAEQLATQIEQLRTAPEKFSTELQSDETLLELVEDSAKVSGLDLELILTINPSDPKPIPETPYQEQKTELKIRDVSLQQVLQFTLQILQSDPGLQVPQFTFRVPTSQFGEESAEEKWDVEFTLTSQSYSSNIPAQ